MHGQTYKDVGQRGCAIRAKSYAVGASMRIEECRKAEQSAVDHCPARMNCPFAPLCGTGLPNAGGRGAADETDLTAAAGPSCATGGLFPTCVDLKPGDLVWVDFRYEQRACAIQSGILSCMANVDCDDEVPFALYGSGSTAGVSEMYIAREVSNEYYLRALTPARLCSFPAKAVRRALENAPAPFPQRFLSCALTNMSAAAFTQHKITLRTPLADRILMFLLYLRELAAREGRILPSVPLTHGDLATLIAAERTATTRALNRLAEEGYVRLGYREIGLEPRLLERTDLIAEAVTRFHRVCP